MEKDLKFVLGEIIALKSVVDSLAESRDAQRGDQDALAKARLNLTAAQRQIENRLTYL